MHKQPPDQTQFLQFEQDDIHNLQQELSPQLAITNSRKQYFYLKITLSIILVCLATFSAQTQMQYYGPFVRTVQNFFNFHMLQHQSQDIYQGGDVIFYRTQQYKNADAIMGFFKKYADTMDTFHQDSFFYPKINKTHARNTQKQQIVKILIISQVDQKEDSKKQLTQKLNKTMLSSQIVTRKRIFFKTHEQQTIVQKPLKKIRQFFNQTVLNRTYYESKLKRIELQTSLYIGFKDNQNCTVQVKVICIFYSGLMMAVKIQTRVLDYKEQNLLKNQNSQQQFNEENLGIRKLSQWHNLSLNFNYIPQVIFGINLILFCIQLMVMIRTNTKIQQNINEQKQFQKQMSHFMHLNKIKHSTLILNQQNQPSNPHSINKESILTFNKQSLYNNQQELLDSPAPIKELTYFERLQLIGIYNFIELCLSFLVLITINVKGLVALWCWAKISIYLSQTGNRMMVGFLFKKAIPAYLIVILNLSIWLSGFVFFSMVTYRVSKKFQTVQLSYYQYLFNYFQYGIFQNFRPIQRYGSFYSFLYFIQMAFLVMIGNNILQSILAQQVLKNSNMQDLIEFIQGIEVQCPVCGCPPQIKKKIKLKLAQQNQRQNRFISQYFQTQKQAINKSKYQIKILSPQFSPMFHKSQYKKKQFKLRKKSLNNISVVGQQSLINSPPLSPLSPSPSPLSHYSPRARALQQQKKKVKFEIGQIQEKNVRKLQQFSKAIKTKSQIINKILFQLSKQDQSINSSLGKHFHIQFLKKKIEEIKLITNKM